MSKHVLRFRQVDEGIFEDIRSGKKIVETRTATIKFKNIKIGDAIIFVCGKDRFEKEVKSAEIFKGISEMLLRYKIKDIAPRLLAEDDLRKMYHSFPGYEEKISKFGLIALEFK